MFVAKMPVVYLGLSMVPGLLAYIVPQAQMASW